MAHPLIMSRKLSALCVDLLPEECRLRVKRDSVNGLLSSEFD